VVVTSEKDRQALGSDNVFVLPNTVVVPNKVAGPREKEQDDDLVFFGLLSYRPNTDAVEYFCAAIWPQLKRARPTARLWIAGANPPPSIQQLHDGTSVMVTGYVDDLAALLARCAVVVTPLRIGGGTRIKILDAMAAGKAVVSTTIGCEGLDVLHGEHLLIADRPADFSRSCLGLMADRGRREALGSAARRLVEERYRWELAPTIVDRILQAVTSRE
jgi:glycosyltransferase involved in cell wall biosynthesis